MASSGDRWAALLSGGDSQGPPRRGGACDREPHGRGEGCGGGRTSLAGRKRLEGAAADECAGGDPLAPLSPLACRLGDVEGWGGVGAGLRLRDGGRGGWPTGDRRPKRTRRAHRAPPPARGSLWWGGGAAPIPRRHLLILAREDEAGGLHRCRAGA